MYHVRDNLHIDVDIDGKKVEGRDLSFISLVIYNHIAGLLPIMQLVILDTQGSFRNKTNLSDGVPILINVGNSVDRQVPYEFRLMNVREENYGPTVKYTISGYLDAYKYFFGSTANSFKGTTSTVIEKIATDCGLTAKVETTADDQTWYQANKRNGEFVHWLAQKGYVDDESIMGLCVKPDKTLVYKDLNKITGENAIFCYDPSSESMIDVQIMAHKVYQSSGSSNAGRGYGDQLVSQDMMSTEAKLYKDNQIDPRSSKIGVNKDVKDGVGKARVEVTPVHYKDQAHENYFKAQHQNTRGQYLNSSQLEILVPVQTKLELLDPVSVRLQSPLIGEDAINSGSYFVLAKNVICKGSSYAEKYRLARAGTNRG